MPHRIRWSKAGAILKFSGTVFFDEINDTDGETYSHENFDDFKLADNPNVKMMAIVFVRYSINNLPNSNEAVNWCSSNVVPLTTILNTLAFKKLVMKRNPIANGTIMINWVR